MTYTFTAQQAQKLYGQKLSIRNLGTNTNEQINVQGKNVFAARRGAEGYGLRAIHKHKKLGNIDAFLKVFQKDIPERRQRSEFLVKLGLAKHHEWVFQGVPYAWFNRLSVQDFEIVGHLTKFIGLQYGDPAEDFVVLKDEGKWDKYSENERKAFAIHLASAVCALERLDIVHGDLSGGNIMIGPGPNSRKICCLCDFDGFYNPSQPLLPRQVDGLATRPLGSPGYIYPEIVARIAADKHDNDNSIFIETDRFALAVLICEMMVWNTKLAKKLGRGQLVDEANVKTRQLSDIPDNVKSSFSAGFNLLERALRAGSCQDMPAPDEWLNCFGVQSVLPAPFKTAPQVIFYRRKGSRREFHRHASLSKDPTGSFGVVHPDLRDIIFSRNDTNHVTLAIGSSLPCALRRSGRQETLPKDSKIALAILPGDLLRIGDWEIMFEESKGQAAQ